MQNENLSHITKYFLENCTHTQSLSQQFTEVEKEKYRHGGVTENMNCVPWRHKIL